MSSSSSIILLDWLNNEIKFRPKITNIVFDFDNGFKFGIVLYKLKEITREQIEQYKNNDNPSDIKRNFGLLKYQLEIIYNLILQNEDIKKIINHDPARATVILYKLKNAVYKKKIKFTNIISLIEKFAEKKNDNVEKNDSKKSQEQTDDLINNQIINNYSLTRKTNYKLTFKSDNNYEESERILENKKEFDDSNEGSNIHNGKNIKLSGTTLFKYAPKKLNLKKFPIIKNIYNNYNKEKENTFENGRKGILIFNNNKKLISTSVIKFYRNNSSEGILQNKKTKTFNKNDSCPEIAYPPIFSTMQNSKNLIKIDNFNNQLKNFGIKDNFKIETERQMSSFPNLNNNKFADKNTNERTIEEIQKELKEKLKKCGNFKSQDILENKNNNDTNKINFLKLNKNLFNQKKPAMSFLFNKYQIKLSNIRRMEYSKELSKNTKQMNITKRYLNYKKVFVNNVKPIIKKCSSVENIHSKTKMKEVLNTNRFFHELSKINYLLNTVKTKQKEKHLNEIYNKIKNIILLVIDLTVEAFFYQKENKTDLMDIDTFINYMTLFIKNQPMREKIMMTEDDASKKPKTFQQNNNFDKIILTDNEKFLVSDYINYLGIWNDKIVLDPMFSKVKLDFNTIMNIKNIEYEPTLSEVENITISKNNINDYIYGNILLDVFDFKYETVKNSSSNSKWEYIPYKIALVGYPLSGRKLVSEKIVKKFPNMKIYSIYKIIRDLYDQYQKLKINLEKVSRNKNTKKKKKETDDDKEKLKQQKQTFDMITKIIQPYIGYIASKGNNLTEDESFIIDDKVLLNVLINKIETDFPKSNIDERNKILINRQKKLNDLNKQFALLNKKKSEAKKPNSNYDNDIVKVQKEINKIKENSIIGFILVDFPNNINQCHLLENYLTGYIPEKHRPKTEKDKYIELLNIFIDFKIKPKEEKSDIKSGLDFVIHLFNKENIINERFNTIKYDPLDDKIYTKSNNIVDKKINERIEKNVPYLTKNIFEYYKQEYNSNITKIRDFYNKFGIKLNSENENNNNNLNDQIKSDLIETTRVFQEIESEEMSEIKIPTDANNSPKKTKKNKNSKNKKEETNESNVDTITLTKEKIDNKDKVYDFIIDDLIERLYINTEIKEQKIFREYEKEKALTKKEKNVFDTEHKIKINVNEITLLGPIKIKTMGIIPENIDESINDLIEIDNKYNKNIGGFIRIINNQKKLIYDRLNLIQRKFRDLLNSKTNKKIIVNNYIKKYNDFFRSNPNLFNDETVIKEFMNDIDSVNYNLWLLISKKQSFSVKSLEEIKTSGFIEVELIKFYENIKNLLLLEADKLLNIINNIFKFFEKKTEETNIKEVNKKLSSIKNSILLNIKPIEFNYNEKNEIIFNNSLNEISNILQKNIEIIFNNCIKLLINYDNNIEEMFKKLKENVTRNQTSRKSIKLRKKSKLFEGSLLSSSLSTDLFNNNSWNTEENIKNMIAIEKNKYKFRVFFIKNFAYKYINLIINITNSIYENLDDWIIKNVSLQSESSNYLVNTLKQILNEKILIDQQNDIDTIELDEFEKMKNENNKSNIIDNNSNNFSSIINNNSNIINSNNNSTTNNDINIKPIDNSSIINTNKIYNKIHIEYLINENFIGFNEKNIEMNSSSNESEIISKREMITLNEKIKTKFNDDDFYFDLKEFLNVYKYIKKFEIEDGIIEQNIFYEVFIKKYIINTHEKNETKDDNKINIYPAICNALKMISSKQIHKLLNLYNLEINHDIINITTEVNQNKNESEEPKRTKNKKKSSKKVKINEKKTSKNKALKNDQLADYLNDSENEIKKETQENITKEIEYKNYINMKEIFTMLLLISCGVLTQNNEEEINKILKDKLLLRRYLSLNDFMEYKFWFEDYFDRKNDNNKIHNLASEKSDLNNESNEKIDYKELNIKYIIFEIWRDNEESSTFDFKSFLNVLEIKKYITDFIDTDDVRYYDIIFNDK